MPGPQTPAMFSEDDRDAIRGALRRYMAEHKIGTPTLQGLIIEADPRRREIPLSTLQRFIAGSHRTQDHHVALCHAFVRELPYYGEGLDIAQFGEAAALMYLLPPITLERREGAVMTPLSLTYSVSVCWDARALDPEVPRVFEPYGSIQFTPTPNYSYSRVTESVYVGYPRFGTTQASNQGEARLLYEGVSLMVGGRSVALLRNQLTRAPKAYWIREGSGTPELQGFGVDSGPEGGWLLREFNFSPGVAAGMPVAEYPA